MKNQINPSIPLQKDRDDGAWTEEEARRLLQGAYETPPPDPALLSRVERRVLEHVAADGPLRSERQRLAGWIAFCLAAYLLLLLACAWFGSLMAPAVPHPSEAFYGAPPYSGVHYTAASSSYPYPGERTRP